MRHLGDITKISGYDVPITDIVVGGSPCQDLSVAGLRKGLSGERSGLFMEQIRIIKQMREKERLNGKANDDIRPRYMVWENVPGAFSSNKGQDFRAVLEETAKIADENAIIPGLAKGQKWTPSGCIMADGWSIAWRVHDAQFWGVPQRRKRIALVADFNGQSAAEILFDRQGMSGDIAQGEAEEQDIARTFADSIGTTKCYGIGSYDSNAMKSQNPNSGIYEADTSRTLDARGGNPACNQGGMVVVDTYDVRISKEGTKNWRAHCYQTDISRCLDTQGENPDTNHGGVCIIENKMEEPIKTECECFADVAACRNAVDGSKGVHSQMLDNPESNFVVERNIYGQNGFAQFGEGVTTLRAHGGDYGGGSDNLVVTAKTYQKITGTLDCCIAKGTSNQLAMNDMFIADKRVRRLTPLECERLQGYPDGWTDIGDWIDSKGKKHKGDSDAPRYTALGNSIALPFWEWMAKRMVKYLDIEHATMEKHPTMASLFDGIGGFPLVFSRAGCEPIWASEIEEFPIAVTKKRFGEG